MNDIMERVEQMNSDKIIAENKRYHVLRREYATKDIIWFVVRKANNKSIDFGTKRQAVEIMTKSNEIDEREGR